MNLPTTDNNTSITEEQLRTAQAEHEILMREYQMQYEANMGLSEEPQGAARARPEPTHYTDPSGHPITTTLYNGDNEDYRSKT